MYEYKIQEVRKVIDGDTVRCDVDLGFGIVNRGSGRGVTIRLSGIDTPESRTRDREEKKYGLAAKEFVYYFLALGLTNGEAILKTFEQDKYGRWLGDFKCGDQWLTEALLEAHHAVPYHGKSKEDIKQLHLANRKILKL